MSDFDIGYTKTENNSVVFAKGKMGPVRKKEYLFVNFLYENQFSSTAKGVDKAFVPTQRVLTLKAEKQGNKWRTFIVGGRFAVAADSLETQPDLVNITKTAEEAAKTTSDGKDVFSEIMQDEARREYAERRAEREKAYIAATAKGDEYMSAERYDAAVEAYEQAISINSYDYKARARLQEVVRKREQIRALETKKSQDLEDLLAEGVRVQDYTIAKTAAEQLIRRDPNNKALQDQLRSFEMRINELDQSRAQARQLEPSAAVKYWDKEFARAEKNKETPARLADIRVERALALYSKSDFKRALQELADALSANPQHRPALLAQALVYLKNNEPYKALNAYTVIITNSRFSPGYYKDRAAIKTQLKDTTGALADYNQAIALDAAAPDLYYGRGQLFVLRKRYDEGIADFAKAAALDPTASRYPFAQGVAYVSLNQVAKAAAQFGIARKIGASSDETRTMGAQAYSKYAVGRTIAEMGQLNLALEAFNNAISLNPELLEAHLEKGYVLMRMMNFVAAEACFSEGIVVSGAYTPIRVARSAARLALRNTDDAMKDCVAALQLEPQNYLATIALADVYIASDREQDAVTNYKKAESISPESPKAYLAHGKALTKLGQCDNAQTLLDKALKYSKENPTIVLLAQTENALRAQDYSAALKLADKCLKSGKVLPEALLAKGVATLYNDGSKEAKDALSQILAVADKDADQYQPRSFVLAAEAYLVNNQPARARQMLDKLLPARRAYLGAEYLTMVGNVRLAADSVDQAKVAFTEAQKVDDTYALAKLGLARCAAKANDIDLCLKLLKESLTVYKLPKDRILADPFFAVIKEDKRFKKTVRDIY